VPIPGEPGHFDVAIRGPGTGAIVKPAAVLHQFKRVGEVQREHSSRCGL
jgi:hypothetical protein